MQIALTMPGTIKNRVSEVAGRRKMQIQDLANKSGVSYDTAKRFWLGEAKGINWPTLVAFCKALDCSVGELFEFTNEEDR